MWREGAKNELRGGSGQLGRVFGRRGAGEESPRLHDSIPLQKASTVLYRVSVVRLTATGRFLTAHPMCVKGLYVFTVLSGLAASGMLQVSGMRIYTSEEVEAVNGTDVRLRCTFESSSPIKPDDVVITWSFRPLKGGPRQSVFYYQRKPFLPQEGLFRKCISWAGDIMGSDASIIIREVKFIYNGSYICQVKNPPDVHGPDGEIKLRVVETASFSGLLLLAFAIAAAISGIVILLLIIASCRRCKRRRQRELEGNEEAPRKERKDPTAW
ncbi:myelin protein zero-like protein 2 [Haplochromis burtoni]|uniref:Myelin protein zero like 2 n=1 Tax=Haplochromis burtoni TaxID=8153 RepID=A0A3Q2XH52_HAPBU|nr:myelin protein zero-like protein 2 [Haplochromis burtoni]